ncbi:MAG TPA: hypothetical protein PK264_06375 [Hyphomicrobiaceae bacterium]|nr:hypothetical protein [Hyphomicrobiaceae bacterium]
MTLIRTLALAAAVTLPPAMIAAPAIAQQVNSGVSANIDPNKLKNSVGLTREQQCRLGLINPRACAPGGVRPSAPKRPN